MLRRLSLLILITAFASNVFGATPQKNVGKQKLLNIPIIETADAPRAVYPVASQKSPYRHLDDYIGTIDTAGTTWWDYQHNGTCGKMIDVNSAGFISVAWMNGLSDGMSRYVYANLWDPSTEDFLYDHGIRVDNSTRAGYVCQTVLNNDLFCYAFHQIAQDDEFHAVAAIPPMISQPAGPYYTPVLIWPKIDADINGNLHMMSASNPWWDRVHRIYYSRGEPEYDQDGFPVDIHWDDFVDFPFELWDTVTVISPDVACDRQTELCAIAWCHPMDSTQINNEIYLRISEDGGYNWGERINITQWTPWDSDCYHSGGDPLYCDRDTFRCYTDVSILFDEDDFIHIAFTTTGFWWYLPGESDSGFSHAAKSMIYHWDESHSYHYSLVANGWYEGYTPGIWQRNVQRPSLAVDPETGYLYCSYMQFDTTTYSESGFPMADAFVSVSTDRGYTWSIGTNVTNTTPDVVPVPAGDSMHERDVTVAPLVTDGFLHMEYILDKDAGSMVQEEGVATRNQVIYQRIPVDEISTTPILPHYPMHWDGWASAPTAPPEVPRQFVLHQNWPNPFNPMTVIQFDLLHRAEVSLKIYNVLGQEVMTLLNTASLSAGVHSVQFDGSKFSSGIYIYSLAAGNDFTTKKMLLLK